jgi:hypothetical protein
VIPLFLNVFDFSRNVFQNLIRRGVRGGAGWCRNVRAQIKNSKLEFKVFFKVLKFLVFFHIKIPFLEKKTFRNHVGMGGVGVGIGERW